jgi:FKBP-type peptidyl-prolyl cis-trans isomerase
MTLTVLTPSARRATLAALALLLAACTSDVKSDAAPAPAGNPDPAANTYAPALGVQLPAFFKTPNGVYYQDVTVGTGLVAASGQEATVHYTGWLPNGTKFDSSRDGGEPFSFGLDQGMVIRGWDEGVKGMKVGGRRKLVIPAALGYGEQGAPPDIPPNSTLVFDVELLAVK